MSIKKHIKEETDGFDWVDDIKTNGTIAKEIYNTIEWHKISDGDTTNYIKVPWNHIYFAVRKRTMSDSKIPLITPSTFYKRFTEYIKKNYGIQDHWNIQEIYRKITVLMGDKIHGTIKESDDFSWLSNTNVDLIKLGSVFIETIEDERFIINNISPSGLTIKSLDFPKDKEDTTIRSNWSKEQWLKLIDDGEVIYSHNIHLNESNDFDWTNSSKLIHPKDLVGYYFIYLEKKYTITKVDEMYLSHDPRDGKLTAYYKYRSFGELRGNKMDVDSIIYRIKGGLYDLYDSEGNPINPDDLVYSDGKLDDVDSVNENSDWDWVKSIGTLPPEIVNFQHLPKGNYKIWFGDMSQERQLLILDYLVDVIELSDGLTTTPALERIRQMVRNGEFYTQALFIIQSMNSENKEFIFTVSGWYPEDKDISGTSKKDSLNRNLRYFNNSTHTDLGKTTLKESNDFDWVKDAKPYIDKVENMVEGEFYEIKNIDTRFFTSLIECGWHGESELIRSLVDSGQTLIVKVSKTMPNAILTDYVYCDGRTASWKPEATFNERGPVAELEFYDSMETSHQPKHAWIPFFDFNITDGMITFYNDNKGLNESKEFNWVDSIKPNVLAALADVSKKDKRINVIYSDENNYFTSIEDERGFNYFTRVTFITYLRRVRQDWDTMPEALLNSMTVDELLNFLEKHLKDTFPNQEPFEVYGDYLYLYEFIKRELK